MSTTIERVCECGCGRKFSVRQADVNRGWGRFASKRCKAREQERRTGQYQKLQDTALRTMQAAIDVDDADDLYWNRKGE